MTEKEWEEHMENVFDSCQIFHKHLDKLFEELHQEGPSPEARLHIQMLFSQIHKTLNENFVQ